MSWRLLIAVVFLALFLSILGIPFIDSQPTNHWFTTNYLGSDTKYYDVIVDANVSTGGSGLIFAVGVADGSPVVTALNPDGSINWTMKYNVMGEARTVTKRVGVYAQPDNLLFVGGIIYAPLPMSFLLVVDIYTGLYVDAWALAWPSFESDRVNDLIIGPDGAVYGVGAVFTNIDPTSPYNTLLFRYDPATMNVTYSLVFLSTTEGHALTTYNNMLYVVETKGTDMYLREVDYSTGVDTMAYKITHSQNFQLIPRDIEVLDGKAYIVGSIRTSSLFLSFDINGTLLSSYSHTNTIWRSIEVGNNNRLFILGDSGSFPLYQNDTSRNLVFLSFLSNVTGAQVTDIFTFGGDKDESSGGLDINNYGYASGYTNSYPYLGLNRSGMVSLVTTNMGNFVWGLGCLGMANVSVVTYNNRYLDLIRYFNITDAPLGSQGTTSNKINIEELDVAAENCIAYDLNNPVIINEFQVVAVLMVPIAIILIIDRYFKRNLKLGS